MSEYRYNPLDHPYPVFTGRIVKIRGRVRSELWELLRTYQPLDDHTWARVARKLNCTFGTDYTGVQLDEFWQHTYLLCTDLEYSDYGAIDCPSDRREILEVQQYIDGDAMPDTPPTTSDSEESDELDSDESEESDDNTDKDTIDSNIDEESEQTDDSSDEQSEQSDTENEHTDKENTEEKQVDASTV